MNSRLTRPNRRRRGAMLPLVAIVLPVLLIFLGFAVDLAYMQTTRMELQAAADSAARAGATRLSQTDDANDARAFAVRVAAANTVAGAPLNLRNSEVEVGRTTRNAAGKWIFAVNGKPANAVRVLAERTRASAGGAVPLFFGSLIGTPSFQPAQTATASFLNVDICLVLDRSTSMKEGLSEDGIMSTSDPKFCRAPDANSRWKVLDGAVRVFLEELADSDADERVALATYGSDLSGNSPALCGASSQASSLDRRLDSNLTAITQAIDRLSTSVWNGNTYIESGMRTGLAAIQDTRYGRVGAEKIMIVLTDGNENVGSAMAAAHDCADAGITVHTITFSDSANQATMKAVADACGGQHFHASTAASLRKVFRELAAQTARLTD
jgi:Ca-activated chloride channel family protein